MTCLRPRNSPEACRKRFPDQTILQFGNLARLKRRHAMVHAQFHLIIERLGIRRLRAGRCDLALEVDGYAHFVEQVHAKIRQSGRRTPCRWTEIDGRQFQIFEAVSSECEFGKRNFTGAGGGGSAPGVT